MTGLTSGSVDRVVIIHGPADPATAAALATAGLAVAAAIGDTTIWAPGRMVGKPSAVTDQPAVAENSRPARHLLTTSEAALALGLSQTTTRKLIRLGELEAVHVGRCMRVPEEAVGDLVRRLRRPARARSRRPVRSSPSSGQAEIVPLSQAADTLESLGDADASQPLAAIPATDDPPLDVEGWALDERSEVSSPTRCKRCPPIPSSTSCRGRSSPSPPAAPS